MEISRRKFFSFFGVGAAMLAKPDLFVPKVVPIHLGVDAAGDWTMWASNHDYGWVKIKTDQHGNLWIPIYG